jgi:hypothetical protein
MRGIGGRMLAATAGGTKLAFVTETGAKVTSHSAVIGPRIRERVTIIDAATGARRVIALPQGEAADDLTFAPDGRHIAYTTETPERHGLRILDSAAGKVHPVAFGGAELGNVAGVDSAHIVTLVFSAGQSRLVWYSLDTLKTTREVALSRYRFPNTPSSMGPFVSGDAVVVMVGDTVFRVSGTNVRRQHADSTRTSPGRQGTW